MLRKPGISSSLLICRLNLSLPTYLTSLENEHTVPSLFIDSQLVTGVRPVPSPYCSVLHSNLHFYNFTIKYFTFRFIYFSYPVFLYNLLHSWGVPTSNPRKASTRRPEDGKYPDLSGFFGAFWCVDQWCYC